MQSFTPIFKRSFCVGFLSLTVLNFAPVSLAVTVESVPNPRQVNNGWVTDMADILSPATEAEINRAVSELEAKNGSEIAVVTVPDTAPSGTPKEFATTLFNRWGIGKKGRDNGVLLLISKGDRRVEIETGYGVEATLPDAKAGNIIKQEIAPRFKQGDFDGGTLAGTKAIVVTLKGEETVSNISATSEAGKTEELFGLPVNVVVFGLVGFTFTFITIILVVAFKKLATDAKEYVKPGERSRLNSFSMLQRSNKLHCDRCKQPMKQLDSALPYLSLAEQVAQKIGSVEFEAWECPKCSSQQAGSGIHIRSFYDSFKSDRFATCPHCQELTVKRTENILQHPTESNEGRSLVTEKCHCCSYYQETEESIPRISPPSSSSFTSSSDSSSSWSSSDSSSSSWSSSDSGSSNFGGGSSGGGGAGDSW